MRRVAVSTSEVPPGLGADPMDGKRNPPPRRMRRTAGIPNRTKGSSRAPRPVANRPIRSKTPKPMPNHFNALAKVWTGALAKNEPASTRATRTLIPRISQGMVSPFDYLSWLVINSTSPFVRLPKSTRALRPPAAYTATALSKLRSCWALEESNWQKAPPLSFASC